MSQRKPDGAVLEMEFPVEVWLASAQVRLGQLLALAPGDEIPLKGDAEETVDLVANGNTLASGELVVVDGKFGVRIKETASTRLARLSGDGDTSPGTDGMEPATEEAATEKPEPEEAAS